jgi:hypothetical protein
MFEFRYPDPEIDKSIIVEHPRGAVTLLTYSEVHKMWVSEDAETTRSVEEYYHLKDSRFSAGVVRWIYQKELNVALDLFMKRQIIKEI